MNRRILCGGLATMALVGCLLHTRTVRAQALSLADALRLADSQSVDVRKARLAVMRAERAIAVEQAEWLPTVQATGDYTLNIQKPVLFAAPGTPFNQTDVPQAYPIGNRHAAGLGLDVAQPLYDPLIRMRRLVAEAGAEVSRAQLQAARSLVRMNTEKAFHRAVYARSERQVREEQIRTAMANLDLSLARFKQGRAMALDTITAGAGVARARADAERSRFAYERALLNLAQLLDLPDRRTLEVTGTLDVPTEPGPSGGDPMLAAGPGRSAAVMVAERERSAARASAELAGATAYPRIDAVGHWQALGQSNQAAPTDARWAMTSHVGVRAVWPISNLWRDDAQQQEAELRVREAELEIERLADADSAQLESLMLDMRGARALITAEHASVEQAEKAIGITMILYREGRATLVDVEVAQSRVLEAQLAEDRAKLQFLDAYAEFKAIVGND